MSRTVKAKLVKRSMCECGALAVWEHVQLGKIYDAYPESVAEFPWQCRVCGKEHVSKMIFVYDGEQPVGRLFLDLFEVEG